MVQCDNYYVPGMCVYVPRNIERALYEKCIADGMPPEIQAAQVENCPNKKLIEALKKRDTELERQRNSLEISVQVPILP